MNKKNEKRFYKYLYMLNAAWIGVAASSGIVARFYEHFPNPVITYYVIAFLLAVYLGAIHGRAYMHVKEELEE